MNTTSTTGRPSAWIYLLAAPVIALMAFSAIRDPGRIGQPAGVAGDVVVVVVIASFLCAILLGVWGLSCFKFRTAVFILQVVVVGCGGLLYALEVRTEVTGLDLAEDLVLLATTVAQLLPGRRRTS